MHVRWLPILTIASSLAAAPALAGDPSGLAPPGPCARPDPATTLVQPLASLPRTGVDPRIHLVGVDVAGPGPIRSLAGPPRVPTLPDRDPCDRPGSGCLGLIQPAPGPTTTVARPAARNRRVRESNPGPGKPPGIP